MQWTQLRTADHNLLRALHLFSGERQVKRAADRLGLGRPAMYPAPLVSESSFIEDDFCVVSMNHPARPTADPAHAWLRSIIREATAGLKRIKIDAFFIWAIQRRSVILFLPDGRERTNIFCWMPL